MDRKWRFNRSALNSVLPYDQFAAGLPQPDAPCKLASITDLYAVYTVLSIENKANEIRWNSDCKFYYFLATLPPPGSDALPRAPHEEEDPELETVTGPVNNAQVGCGCLRASVSLGCLQRTPIISNLALAGSVVHRHARTWCVPASSRLSGLLSYPMHLCGDCQAPALRRSCSFISPTYSSRSQPPLTTIVVQAGGPAPTTQLLIPISTAYSQLTPALLQRLFPTRAVNAQQVGGGNLYSILGKPRSF